MVRMHMGEEDRLDAGRSRSQGRNPVVVCRRRTANDAGTEVDKIRCAVHHDGGCGPGTGGIGRGVPVPSMTIWDAGARSADGFGWIWRTRQSSRILEVLTTLCQRSVADVSKT